MFNKNENKKSIKEFLANPEIKVDIDIDIKNIVMFSAGALIGIILGASGRKNKTKIIVIK